MAKLVGGADIDAARRHVETYCRAALALKDDAARILREFPRHRSRITAEHKEELHKELENWQNQYHATVPKFYEPAAQHVDAIPEHQARDLYEQIATCAQKIYSGEMDLLTRMASYQDIHSGGSRRRRLRTHRRLRERNNKSRRNK